MQNENYEGPDFVSDAEVFAFSDEQFEQHLSQPSITYSEACRLRLLRSGKTNRGVHDLPASLFRASEDLRSRQEEDNQEQISKAERMAEIAGLLSEQKHHLRLSREAYEKRKALLAPRVPAAHDDWMDRILTQAIEQGLVRERQQGDLE